MRIIHFTYRFLRRAIAAATVALVTTPAVSAQQAATYEIVSSFEGPLVPNGVIQARDGQFYGTTSSPFVTTGTIGTVFRMDASGVRTTLHTFRMGNPNVVPVQSDGFPMSNLFEDADGSLYGTTFNEIEPEYPFTPGQVFKIGPAGDFTTLASAHLLRAGVIRAREGRLYLTTSAAQQNSTNVWGTIRRLSTDGTTGLVLHTFNGLDSSNPVAELVEVDDGTLYGTTEGRRRPQSPPLPEHGTIFRVDPVTQSFTTRHVFNGLDGSKPLGRLIQGSDGLIYGTTSIGGAYGFGTVFSFDAAGNLATLHHFAGADGANLNAGVVQGFDGRLYGTTRNGGAFGYGTVFVIDVTGDLTTLHDFTGAEGANPVNELIQANDGAFYGAASIPGEFLPEGGVIFRVRVTTATPDGFVEIVSRNSDKCLDVSGASTDAAAPVIQWTCSGGLNQQWRLEPAGGGAFRIIARHSGQALDVYGASLDDVAPIIQWPVHGGENQAWTLEPASDGYVRLVVRHSGKAMDVEFASTDDGARVIQYLPHGGANQQWLLRPVESTSTSVTTVHER
jgi:uncharacterized repeat protein (TIGR03803 family)